MLSYLRFPFSSRSCSPNRKFWKLSEERSRPRPAPRSGATKGPPGNAIPVRRPNPAFSAVTLAAPMSISGAALFNSLRTKSRFFLESLTSSSPSLPNISSEKESTPRLILPNRPLYSLVPSALTRTPLRVSPEASPYNSSSMIPGVRVPSSFFLPKIRSPMLPVAPCTVSLIRL